MYFTTQTFIQANTIFGGGYMPEQHGDEADRYLPPMDKNQFVVDFSQLMKALRATLSLR